MTSPQKLDVSVIVITADRKKDLLECLDSLAIQSKLPSEVIYLFPVFGPYAAYLFILCHYFTFRFGIFCQFLYVLLFVFGDPVH